MKTLAKLSAASMCVAALSVVITYRASGLSQQPVDIPQQQGVEVEARGPIHEAYMEPDNPDQIASPIVPKRPPEPINELPSEDRPQGDQFQWIPGYWAWDDDRGDFLWVSGIWRAPPPGRQWVPGYWQQANAGWQWVSGYWAPVAEQTVELLPPPPELIEEAVPPAPDQDSVFIPGIWVFQRDSNQYWWHPGHWIHERPGWIWTPACYHWTPGGYIFVNGYWDHEIGDRGIAFAPVYFSPTVIARRDFYYRPAYALAADALLQSLFVRTGGHHYWFGDYYDAAYARRGYRPWIEQRVANVHDPLYSHYRWQHREDPRWEQALRSAYTTRRENAAARPPRTLVEQNRPGAKVENRVVVPIRETRVHKVEPTPKEHVDQIRKSTEDWRRFSQERHQVETTARTPQPSAKPPVVTTPPPAKAQAAPTHALTAPARVEMPKRTIEQPRVTRTPPPPPNHPAPVARPAPPHREKEKEKK